MTKRDELVLCRANTGDWSLHPPAKDIPVGTIPTLKSGPAQKVSGKWDRPNKEDYDIAWMMYRHHQAQQKKQAQEPYPKRKARK